MHQHTREESAPATRKRRGIAVLIAAAQQSPTPPNTSRPSVPPRRDDATCSHRHLRPRSLCTALALPLSAPHRNTQSDSERTATHSASYVRTRIPYLDTCSGRSRGTQRTAANQATAARGPACSCSVEVLVDHTTAKQQPCKMTHARFDPSSRGSSSTALKQPVNVLNKPSCKRRSLQTAQRLCAAQRYDVVQRCCAASRA
jgi:hypothetical protein